MDDLKFFEELKFVDGGFSTRKTTATEKRDALARRLKAAGGVVIYPQLVHGRRVVCLDEKGLGDLRQDQPQWREDGLLRLEETDGVITNIPGVVLTTTHADCIPVYLCDPVKKVIGLAHAGWKGTCLGIADVLAARMQEYFGCDPADMAAVIGPGICRDCFEVQTDVKETFLRQVPWSAEFVEDAADGKYKIDLKGINRRWLTDRGIQNITDREYCTCCSPERFYSYRKCRDSERCLAWLALNL